MAVDSGSASTTDTASQGLELLKRLETKYMKTMTFYGEFNQTKISKLFLEEIKSKGKFWYQKPGKFRCEYVPPNAQVNLILDDVAYVYIPDIKQVEVYHFEARDSPVKKLNQMLLGFGVSVKDVLDVYEVHSLPEEETEDSFSLFFKLKKKEEGSNFESIKLSVRKKDLLPMKLVFIEPGSGGSEGDRTEILLKPLSYACLKAGGYFGYRGFVHGQWFGADWMDGFKLDLTDNNVLNEVAFLDDTSCELRCGDEVGYGVLELVVSGKYPRYGYQGY